MSQIERNIHRDLPLMAAWEAGTVAALLLFGAVFAISVHRARNTNAPVSEITEVRAGCVDEYNSLLYQAEDDLTIGDHTATIRLLRAAQEQLRSCVAPGTQDVVGGQENSRT
jgi:hypothetical protein